MIKKPVEDDPKIQKPQNAIEGELSIEDLNRVSGGAPTGSTAGHGHGSGPGVPDPLKGH